MAPRCFTTLASPFKSQRSVLSLKAEWPSEEPAEVVLATAPRYTDEQHLALCAWSSARFRQLPVAEQLRTLLHYPGLNARPVYARQARAALATGCPVQQAKALAGLQEETERLRVNRRKLKGHIPMLLTAIAA